MVTQFSGIGQLRVCSASHHWIEIVNTDVFIEASERTHLFSFPEDNVCICQLAHTPIWSFSVTCVVPALFLPFLGV